MSIKDGKGNGEVIGFLGRGMSFEGKLHFENTVRIDGSFKGEITSNGTLVVGEGAEIEAEIRVDTAVITGLVKGRVEASNRVELQFPCRVSGEIRTPNLIIGEGALFQGNCVMLKKDGKEPAGIVTYEAEPPREFN